MCAPPQKRMWMIQYSSKEYPERMVERLSAVYETVTATKCEIIFADCKVPMIMVEFEAGVENPIDPTLPAWADLTVKEVGIAKF